MELERSNQARMKFLEYCAGLAKESPYPIKDRETAFTFGTLILHALAKEWETAGESSKYYENWQAGAQAVYKIIKTSHRDYFLDGNRWYLKKTQ